MLPAWPGPLRATGDAKPSGRRAARIHPNAVCRDSFWCSFSVLEGEVTDEGIFPMNSHRSFSHVITQASGPAGGAHRMPSTGAVRTWAMRGIVVLALALGGAGAAASAPHGHGSTTSHVQSSPLRPWMY